MLVLCSSSSSSSFSFFIYFLFFYLVCNGLEAYFFSNCDFPTFSSLLFFSFFNFSLIFFQISFQTILFWYKLVFFIYDFPYYVFHPTQYFFVFACMGKPSLTSFGYLWSHLRERERERERESYNQFMLYSMTLTWQSVFLTIEFNCCKKKKKTIEFYKNKWLKKGCSSSKVIPNITWIFLSPHIYGWVQITPSITLSNVTSPNNLL